MDDQAAAPQKTAKVLVALAVGVPATALIPLARWWYGWEAALAVVLLGAVPAYLFGAWDVRRSRARTLWCLLAAAPPFVLAAWSIFTHPRDLTGWFWLATAAVTFLAARFGAAEPGAGA